MELMFMFQEKNYSVWEVLHLTNVDFNYFVLRENALLSREYFENISLWDKSKIFNVNLCQNKVIS